MTAVYKRELRSYFNSMIGYVYVAAVMLVIGLYFTLYNLRGGHPFFAYALAGTLVIFAFAVACWIFSSSRASRSVCAWTVWAVSKRAAHRAKSPFILFFIR